MTTRWPSTTTTRAPRTRPSLSPSPTSWSTTPTPRRYAHRDRRLEPGWRHGRPRGRHDHVHPRRRRMRQHRQRLRLHDRATATAAPTPANVDLDLTCVNDDPVANADNVNVHETRPTTTSRPTSLATIRRRQRRTLSVSAVSSPTGGTVELNGETVTFTPDADLCGNGVGGFDYDVSDGDGGIDLAHVTVNVNCVSNDPPAAVDDPRLRDRGHRPRGPRSRHGR